MLAGMGFSLQGNAKVVEGKAGPAGANDNLYIIHDGAIILTATDRWDTVQLTC
jgi:hypothetical protein